MPVTTILLLRHGHRLAWSLDPTTGKYSSSHPYPTKLPADPPLAAYGVRQAEEVGAHLEGLLGQVAKEGRLRIYSSLFYRCLETLRASVENLRRVVEEHEEKTGTKQKELLVRGERGVGEWFGKAWFKQPAPASAKRLKSEFFDWVDEDYESLVVPSEWGERIDELHDRIRRALEAVVGDVDREFEEMGRGGEDVTLLICGHAAQIIASGRALTGQMPEDLDEDDFQCYTCGISKFVRRKERSAGEGVAGGWDCVLNSDCEHLSSGAERGWHFHGDESFDSYGHGPGMQTGTGVVKVSDGGMREGGKEGSKL
jgi:transcription factor C subunit 7